MQKTWSSFRITLLLYILVFILPFSFYFVYTSFKTMQSDTKVVRQVSWTGGAIEQLAIVNSSLDKQNMILQIDTSLVNISNWVIKHNTSDLYIGASTLSEDMMTIESCWNSYKQKLIQKNENAIKVASLQCYALIENLALVIEKMVYLKQNKIINIFYFSLAMAMMFLLLVIYFIRIYIHIQMKRHAILDLETNLFNQKYFLSELKSSCARAVRHVYPLSILHIEIEGFEKASKRYDKETKLRTLKAFGTFMHTLVRDGDLPSRYDENHFLILLPFTSKENALLFEKRIREAMMKDDCMISENIKLNFTITEFDKEETEEALVQRTLAS